MGDDPLPVFAKLLSRSVGSTGKCSYINRVLETLLDGELRHEHSAQYITSLGTLHRDRFHSVCQ
jgi:hypothetical protein